MLLRSHPEEMSGGGGAYFQCTPTGMHLEVKTITNTEKQPSRSMTIGDSFMT
jgi:hypothetical protein